MEIDKGIVDVVKALNARGFKTDSCCSGLREDHPTQKRCDLIPYVNIVGKRLELIEIAETCGWEWDLCSRISYDKDGRPLSYVNYSGGKGHVHKITKGPKGFKQTSSSKQEAIQSQLLIESISLLLNTEDTTKDTFIKQKTQTLLESIQQLPRT